jgi:hypothetical protein
VGESFEIEIAILTAKNPIFLKDKKKNEIKVAYI